MISRRRCVQLKAVFVHRVVDHTELRAPWKPEVYHRRRLRRPPARRLDSEWDIGWLVTPKSAGLDAVYVEHQTDRISVRGRHFYVHLAAENRFRVESVS